MADPNSGADPVHVLAPLAGWVLPLAEVPDPAFADGLAGDGVAIDPVGAVLHAPCDGVVALLGNARHALTLRSQAGDVLMHVGIDTVRFDGAGFELRVHDGRLVRAGEPLLGFDLDAIVRGARSAVTPVVLAGPGGGRILRRNTGMRVRVGDLLFVAAAAGPADRDLPPAVREAATRWFRVPFDHGLHARPAARVAAALAGLEADVTFQVRGRSGDARSVTALMALGTCRGEAVQARAHGRDAARALAALAALLEPLDAAPAIPAPAPAPAAAPRAPASPPAAGTRLPGVVAARGLASGTAVPLRIEAPPVAAAAGDPAAELHRLGSSLAAVGASLEALAAAASGARRGLLEAHLALLNDPQSLRRARELIATGASAGQAWRAALREAATALAGLADPRMAERRADLLDIEQQVLAALTGASPDIGRALPEAAIVIADELLPSQLMGLDAARLAGVCLAGGGATSHVAILAASMGVPMLIGVGAQVLGIGCGTALCLDAEEGALLVAPRDSDRARMNARRASRARLQAEDAAAAALPASTRDDVRVHVYCNLGGSDEAGPAVLAGAEGCGLLRTEFLFLERETAPDPDEQLAVYQAIAERLAGRPLTIRTLDAGGDKPLPYAPLPHEENPALGLRGLRTSLAHPGLLAAQLEAIVRVEPAGQCRVLLPMVTDLDDVRRVRALLRGIAGRCGRREPALGVMIETPAAALLAAQLGAEVDFLSIGSNDLAQYTLAMDRLQPMLAPRLDGLHPAVLQLVARAATAGSARGIEVGVCGGLASDPQAVPLLLGFGVRELSVVPAAVPGIKGLIRRLSLAECGPLAREALELGSAAAVRARMRATIEQFDATSAVE